MKLKDRVAIVTGTSPNIGGGIAEALAAEGAALVAVDAVAENANDCAAYIQGQGGKALGITCDVTDEAQVKEAVAQAVATFGKVDVLVNNAAIFNKQGVLDMSYDFWLRQTGIILGGAFLFTKHVAQSLIERQLPGSIINIISTAGHQGEPRNVAYSTSKGGLMNFTRSTAMELVSHNIRVNSLTPTATDRAESFDRAERWGRKVERPATDVMAPYRAKIPMQKLPSPSDYGRAAVFLASDDAAMITGTDLRVDAGAIARYWPWDPSEKGM
ncbi:SDR family NAD(P)-dependent oxidoreductase [Marinibaculum pumilum]|uniref:SDR family NAD(P)-dependent oxidoreductase n=1 Tax=Marinibaculum pumilum TaxID=1766165 RepID=A0ABV7KU48_9PROT